MNGEELVTLLIDPYRCVGIGQCVQIAPDAVELDDEGISRPRSAARVSREMAGELREACPARAISIAEEAGSASVAE